MAQKSRYGRFQPTAHGWGTIHPVLDMAPLKVPLDPCVGFGVLMTND
jgi:hypothetical protein